MDEVLFHHGIKGMKWGVRRTPEQLGHRTKNSSSLKYVFKKKTKPEKSSQEKQASSKPAKKLSELSDDELREKISRLELERKYRQLLTEAKPKEQVGLGKKFIHAAGGVLGTSVKNIATQYMTYEIGRRVNELHKKYAKDDRADKFEDIVNPRKGQKDK